MINQHLLENFLLPNPAKPISPEPKLFQLSLKFKALSASADSALTSNTIYRLKWFRPQSLIINIMPLKLSPISVREYSTFGGTSA